MLQCEFDINGCILRGQRYGQQGGLPFFALHGWLDNSASFELLLPKLNGLDVVALDLPGQGHSDWRVGHGAYNIWQDLFELLIVAEQLGWSSFGLIGHSRGAMIATMLAGTFPDKVTHLAVIEALRPGVIPVREAPQQIASSLKAAISEYNSPRARNYYSSFEHAVKAREKGLVALNKTDATLLARRGVAQDEHGFYWNNDPRLLFPSEMKLSVEQADALVAAIPLRIDLILGSHGIVADYPDSCARFRRYDNVRIHALSGYHHHHMSTACGDVATILNTVSSL